MDMSSLSKYNKGIKFLLAVIDIFSKYGWLIPLKDKKGETVAKAFKTIFMERKPEKIWVDKGKEFYNKHVQNLIELYSTENEEKSAVVERWNRTMKDKMYKYFTANNTWTYIDILDELVDLYNNTKHSTIKMTPVEASQKKQEKTVRKNIYLKQIINNTKDPKFKVGDKVRIFKKKGTFEKGYTPRWTEELFIISKVLYTNPPTYHIKDLNNENIKGSFYEQELQKTEQDIFRVEKVLKKKGNESLVKWLGYPDSFNSWVNNKDLIL